MLIDPLEQRLCQQLRDLPERFANRYTEPARRELLEILFRSLAAGSDAYLPLFFPRAPPRSPAEPWSLRDAQGAVEGAEYHPAARGHPCGHIFKSGEASYRCKTCAIDDTCVLCARCFDASDHEGHTVFVSISPGNSGCCDCGDTEAWLRPVHCNIHTAVTGQSSKAAGKAREDAPLAGAPTRGGGSLPPELVAGIRTTIARALDYFCDVFSCSPEQLRLPKTEVTIREDEASSRLTSKWYGVGGGGERGGPGTEFALVLWNDEKHTVDDVRDQVARACKQKKQFGHAKALEVDDVGRSVVVYSPDVGELLRMAKIIEDIKLTVTVRSARDTFREQMCGTIIEWVSDIAGCSVGADHQILRCVVCEEILKSWRVGSEAHHSQIGKDGIDDHEAEDYEGQFFSYGRFVRMARAPPANDADDDDDDGDDTDGVDWEAEEHADEDEDDEDDEDDDSREAMDVDGEAAGSATGSQNRRADVDLDMFDAPDELEASEATLAGYPRPPPPPPPPARRRRDQDVTPADSDGEPVQQQSALEPMIDVPKTPKAKPRALRPPRPPKYWLEKPEGYGKTSGIPPAEDLWTRVRLDYMILYDLRMWKKARIDMRDLFISTVVTIPHFKRLLGIRFAGLYTTLAQLYLIADREPDHSIINLSLQMLTTPSITAEVVERGNFLTNLMSILYTFLTTRQVGYPWEVNPMATLAFDAGAVTNRRMYHFFLDMKYLLGSEHIKQCLSREERYLMQFLDLVKLHQGICPNVRAEGEHLEYETDAWISASLITREINKLCRQVADAFSSTEGPDSASTIRAIRRTAKIAIINSIGAERKRFDQAEIKGETRFKQTNVFEFEAGDSHFRPKPHKIVEFTISKEPMSFHHALHYTLSWFIDRGKSMSSEQLRSLLLHTVHELRELPVPLRASIPEFTPDEYLLALFDYPLRVCAWLAQMRAGMWVRNGITLRHQMSTYRGVLQRDVTYQRDIFLLQVALVVCPTAPFLATIVERYGMTSWVLGLYKIAAGFEETQVIDVAEDFVHLLIILLSDRIGLLSLEDKKEPHLLAMRRDLAHVLCFKPLSHSDLSTRVPDKAQETDDFAGLLREMTRYRPPEGLSDVGTFELKEEFIEGIDPYTAQYNRNQREEAENIYKNFMSKKTGKQAADIVFEPKLHPIRSGVFKDLAAFTRLPLFSQIVYYLLGYALVFEKHTPSVPATRIEAFVHFVLQLILVAVLEDKAGEDEMSDGEPGSFGRAVLERHASSGIPDNPTILSILHTLTTKDAFKSCEPKIQLIFYRLQKKHPQAFAAALLALNISPDRMETSSPAGTSSAKELKKQMAKERQAKIMAQFKEQQSSFMANQAIDWGVEDFSDLEDEFAEAPTEQIKTFKFPTGTCMMCQEDTDDQRLYGTLAYITESKILRQTNVEDRDWVEEVTQTPDSLDRSAEHLRPFGVARKNRRTVEKISADGRVIATERQGLGKGFPYSQSKPGPVTTGCGHIMHYSCFEVYSGATLRRHTSQIARDHPERTEVKEFICPLCKALGNTFLPIIWKSKTVSYPGVLSPEAGFDDWLVLDVALHVSKLDKTPDRPELQDSISYKRHQKLFFDYGCEELIPLLAAKFSKLQASPDTTGLPIPPRTVDNPPITSSNVPRPSDFVAPATTPDAAPAPSSPSAELIKIYARLRDTMRVNHLPSRYSYAFPSLLSGGGLNSEELTNTDTLAKALGYSISAVEIAHRGVGSEVGTTLIDRISPQSLSHLRVLSETMTTYVAYGSTWHQNVSRTHQEFYETQQRQLHMLFVGHPAIFDQSGLQLDLKAVEPLLTQDAFVFLAECSVCVVPAVHLDIHHIMRLCYLAEIVRVIMAYTVESPAAVQFPELASEGKSTQLPEQAHAFSAFVEMVVGLAEDYGEVQVKPKVPRADFFAFLRTMVASYALPFVRKAAILMAVRYGVEFPNTGSTYTDVPELERLSAALCIPSLDEMLASLAADTHVGATTRAVVEGWVKHWAWAREGKNPLPRLVSLSHPAVFELVGLPKNYDVLTDEAIRRRCPTTGKELTDPCVCLFCGEIFCSQAVCCTRDKNKGGCYQHQAKCGGNIGLYINIRKCMVLLMNLGQGSWMVAPYLDSYGEVDPALRRHHQLFLNQRRYDILLRAVWLNHGVPSAIARKLEGDINSGGWETL